MDVSGMTHDFRGALPATLAGVDRIVANSDRTAASTAKVMSNLAEATKPLPKWARWTLGITGAVAPTAAGAVSIAVATGAFH